jgi:hypothetical protein
MRWRTWSATRLDRPAGSTGPATDAAIVDEAGTLTTMDGTSG